FGFSDKCPLLALRCLRRICPLSKAKRTMANCSSTTPIYHGLLRGFVLRLLADFILGALYFAKARVITGIDAFLAGSHPLVACSKFLTCVLLPAIKRLLLFFGREVIVIHNIIRRGVKCRRMFDLIHLWFCHINHDCLPTSLTESQPDLGQ